MGSEVTSNRQVSRETILDAERQLLEYPQVQLPTKHTFGDGVYAREIFIAAGTTLTGKIHKYECINVISYGEIEVLTEQGMKRITAPYTFVSPPGTKRIGFAISDCVWITIHRTPHTDLALIEQDVIAQDFNQYEQFKLQQTLALTFATGE